MDVGDKRGQSREVLTLSMAIAAVETIHKKVVDVGEDIVIHQSESQMMMAIDKNYAGFPR